MSEGGNGGGKRAGKIGLGVAGLAAVLFLFGKGFGFGTGGANGIIAGNGTETAVSQPEQENPEKIAETEEAAEQAAEEIPSTVIVRIEKDKVYVLGALYETEEALEKRIRELNADDRTFRLEDDHSIYATYLMVDELFRKLGITLYQEK